MYNSLVFQRRKSQIQIYSTCYANFGFCILKKVVPDLMKIYGIISTPNVTTTQQVATNLTKVQADVIVRNLGIKKISAELVRR